MRIYNTLITVFTLSFLIGCSSGPGDKSGSLPKNGRDSRASYGYNLLLSWSPQSDANRYHVFYVAPDKSEREIDSLAEGDLNFTSPKISIDSSNMETWPEAGQKACFYVVANNGAFKSEPSFTACIVL